MTPELATLIGVGVVAMAYPYVGEWAEAVGDWWHTPAPYEPSKTKALVAAHLPPGQATINAMAEEVQRPRPPKAVRSNAQRPRLTAALSARTWRPEIARCGMGSRHIDGVPSMLDIIAEPSAQIAQAMYEHRRRSFARKGELPPNFTNTGPLPPNFYADSE